MAGLRLGLAALMVAASGARAEPLLAERVESDGFVFYRDSRDAKSFYYAPRGPRVARDEQGRPEFRFIKYTRAGSETTAQTRGGLVHFLVEWGFDEETMREARRALSRAEAGAEIVGPLPFEEGTFRVVSASAGQDGVFTRRIVGEGKAPVLPGHKAAASIALTPAGATVLWESFQQDTSEVSVNFLLRFEGLTPAYEAKVRVNWDEVYKHHDFQLGVEGQYAAFRGKLGIRTVLDDLRREGAIEVEKIGESASMDEILDVAYEHIIDQMFDPVMLPPDAASNPQPLARRRRGAGPRDAARPGRPVGAVGSEPALGVTRGLATLALLRGTLGASVEDAETLPALDYLPLGRADAGSADSTGPGWGQGDRARSDGEDGPWGPSSSRAEREADRGGEGTSEEDGGGRQPGTSGAGEQESAPAAISVEIGYAFRRIRQSGRYQIDLRQRLREEQELSMAGNIGGFLDDDERDSEDFLLEVNLDDPFFRDRTVEVLLDGQDHADLKRYVNAVEVRLRHRHEDGSVSEGDVRFTAAEFAREGNRLTWTYPRLGDPAGDWLRYEYRVAWSFYGGAQVTQDWRRADDSVLTLSSPLDYRTLRVSLDGDDLRRHDVRAVVVQFRHELRGESVVEDVLIDYAAGDPLTKEYRYLAAPDREGYELRTFWLTEDGEEIAGDWRRRRSHTLPLLLRFPAG